MLTLLNFIDYALAVTSVVLVGTILFARRLYGTKALPLQIRVKSNAMELDAVGWAMLAYFLTVVFLLPDDPKSERALLSGVAGHLAGAGACLVLAARRFEGGVAGFLRRPLGLPFRRLATLCLVLLIAALGLTILTRDISITMIGLLAPGYVPAAHPTLVALSRGGDPVMLTVLWLGAAVVAPVAEEFFFRGLLQNALFRQTKRQGLAIVMTAAAFGLVHFGQPPAIVPLFVFGLILGYVYFATGSILAAVVVHALFNMKTLLWQALAG